MPEEKFPQPDTPDSMREDAAGQPELFIWTKQKILACALGGAALFSAPFVVIELDDYRANSPNYSAAETPGDRSLPVKEEEQCPEVPDSFVKKAERMLRAPENPIVTKAVEKALLSEVTTVMPPSNMYDMQRITKNRTDMWRRPVVRFPVAQKKAQELDLTVLDSREYAERMGNGTDVDSGLSRQEVLRDTQKFLKKYGITISLATEKEYPVTEPIGNGTISDNVDTPQAMYDIAKTIATYPKEYLALSGINHIVLANELESGKENEVFNKTAALTDGRNMWFDVEHVNAKTIAHEIGHGAMRAMCGGVEAADNDPQLSEGMQGKHAYDPEYDGVSYEDYATELSAIEAHARDDEPYKAELKRLQTEAGDIATTTDYAHVNVSEDGAETIEALTTDTFYKMRHAMAMPKLRNKLNVVLARLLYYRPHIAEYFMETSLKNEKTSSPLDAIMHD
jgi:hypothetical protein